MRSYPRGSASLACGLAFSLFALLGCGGAEDDLPRQAISGTVTLDGKPLEAGSITFDPADPGAGRLRLGVRTDRRGFLFDPHGERADAGLLPGVDHVVLR